MRSVQVHDEPVVRAEAGQRVALALPGVERSELRRGDTLATPGAFRASYRLDVELQELSAIADGTRLLVHHGTAAVPARVVRFGSRAQLRLAAPVTAARGDRVVLRDGSTVGGGVVLDAAPARHSTPGVAPALHAPRLLDGGWRFSEAWLEELRARLDAALDAADPLDPGVTAPTEPWAREVLAHLPFELRGSRLYRAGAAAELGGRADEAAAIESALAGAGAGTVKVESAEIARYLEGAGRLVRLGGGHAVSADAFERARQLVLAECEAAGQIGLARFRDLAGCGRRDAQLLLERLDADGVTRRQGDARVLRRRRTATG